MDLSIAQELRVFESRNQPQHALLLAVFQVILKADQIVRVGALILFAQLHYRIGELPSSGIFEADWLHRTKPERLAPAPPNLLDRQTAFKVIQLLPVLPFD